MSKYPKLFDTALPCFHIAPMETMEFDRLLWELNSHNKSAVIRIVRGNRSETKWDFFKEISAALQFPLYFGYGGWPSFNECITELDWVPSKWYVILISDASSMLVSEPANEFENLITVLKQAHETWAAPDPIVSPQRPPAAFHMVFQCSREEVDSFSKRLKEADASFDFL